MNKQILCRVLTGPTASGKSDLALRIAKEEGWVILCMDSMQIYRGMDIGTAKPTAFERSETEHYMLDICDPREPYSVSRYVQEAERTVIRLHSEEKEVLFVGGTGLYLEGMMKPMRMGSVPADPDLRDELHRIADGPEGRNLIDQMLRKYDPDTADKLPLNDLRRRIRAIEVSRLTGVPFSRQGNKAEESCFSWKVVSTFMNRETLYQRINRRVDRMIADGLADEVRELVRAGVPEDAQSMQAIGYKEMIPYLHGECTMNQAAEEIKTNSRHYAKRQMTFLKKLEGITYVSTETNDACREIKKILKG